MHQQDFVIQIPLNNCVRNEQSKAEEQADRASSRCVEGNPSEISAGVCNCDTATHHSAAETRTVILGVVLRSLPTFREMLV